MNLDRTATSDTKKPTFLKYILWVGTVGIFAVISIFVFVSLALSSPSSFPTNSTITIEYGTGISEIADLFKKEGYVRSANLLHYHLISYASETQIHAGTYVFQEALTVRELAQHLFDVGPVENLLRLTFPEGIPVSEFARIADSILPTFDPDYFKELATGDEGMLFPDTYFVPETYEEEQLFNLLTETYESNIAPLRSQIQTHELSENEIVTLASIIEREANSIESMNIVSGILQNRLEIDMSLQADASIEYVLNKPLSELVSADLQIDSPYNTYLYRGLPPTPIGNPGINAIEAVLNPTPSNNLYYITDNNGDFHYAQTFDQHRMNIARFLR
ncbi:MAG: UPF0755 protein [Candidatus Azotimanducaceae bacterium]|jgi:UPF0755 protein